MFWCSWKSACGCAVNVHGSVSVDNVQQQFGISVVVVPKDRDTRECKGYGFLTFVSPEDAVDALKGMDGKELNGGTITVEEATQRRSMDRDRRGPPKGSME